VSSWAYCEKCGWLWDRPASHKNEGLWRRHGYESPQCETDHLGLAFVVEKTLRCADAERKGRTIDRYAKGQEIVTR
jgi:hypothetical protein